MKQLKKFPLLFLLLFGMNVFGQWTPIPIDTSKTALQLNFIDDNVGYAMILIYGSGQKILEKTTNAGTAWTNISLPAGAGDFQAFHFHADGVGVAVFRNTQGSTTPTTIYQTLNDGLTWQNISPDTTENGIGSATCFFVNQNIGFFGTDQFIYRTVDGGANWTTIPTVGYPMTMDFFDANHGTVGLFDGTFAYMGSMMSTTDGGQTWLTTQLNDYNTVIQEVNQISSSLIYAAPVKWGSFSRTKFFKSADSGLSWDTLYVPDTIPNADLADLQFKDAMNGQIIISDYVNNFAFSSTDGGNTWLAGDSLPYFDVTDLELTPNSGFLAGNRGIIYKLSIPLAISSVAEPEFALFPNPVKTGEELHWKTKIDFDEISLTDVFGRIVVRQSGLGNTLEIPNVVPGVYFVSFIKGQERYVNRIIIQN